LQYCTEHGNFTKNNYPLFVQTYQNTNTQAATALYSLLKRQNWTRIGIIYEEQDPFWVNFENTLSKDNSLDIVTSRMVPKWKKFQEYGERFLVFPRLEERNRSLATVRKILTEMADRDRVKGEL
jgi:hypothetical protein